MQQEGSYPVKGHVIRNRRTKKNPSRSVGEDDVHGGSMTMTPGKTSNIHPSETMTTPSKTRAGQDTIENRELQLDDVADIRHEKKQCLKERRVCRRKHVIKIHKLSSSERLREKTRSTDIALPTSSSDSMTTPSSVVDMLSPDLARSNHPDTLAALIKLSEQLSTVIRTLQSRQQSRATYTSEVNGQLQTAQLTDPPGR